VKPFKTPEFDGKSAQIVHREFKTMDEFSKWLCERKKQAISLDGPLPTISNTVKRILQEHEELLQKAKDHFKKMEE
jgi:hypothetical protein